jgi:hypothetical protein
MKKWVMLVILILLAAFIIYLTYKPQQITFSEKPKDWIKSINQTSSMINTIEATAGKGYYEQKTQYIMYKNSIASLKYIGYYNGEFFQNEYLKDNHAILRVQETLTPNDGTADIFLIQTFEEEKPVIYVFLDNDWKKLIPETNAVWGSEYQYERRLSLQELKPGIYFDKITDEERFYKLEEGPVQKTGGLLIGNTDSKSFKEGKIKDKIFLRQI